MIQARAHTARDVLTGLRPELRAALLAGLATVVVLVGSSRAQSDPPRSLDAEGLALAAVAGLSLAWAPRFPRGVLAVVVLAVCGYLGAGYPFGPVQLCLAAAVFFVGRRTSFRDSAWACALAVVAVAVVVHPRLSDGGGLRFDELGSVAWAAGWLVLPWSLGALTRARAGAGRLRQERVVADAVFAERMRLARDVHDVAGHGFALVAMQAGVALLTLEERPAQARASLEAIRSASTEALAELRNTLGTFGAPPVGLGSPRLGEAAVPQALPARLARLVDGLRGAGMDVRLSLYLPPGIDDDVDDVVYRIVQESLTNVLRHAAGASATVSVRSDGGDLLVTVADRGAPARENADPVTAPGHRPGLGIPGMRERVQAVGGTLLAGPEDGTGFTVEARLPRRTADHRTPSS